MDAWKNAHPWMTLLVLLVLAPSISIGITWRRRRCEVSPAADPISQRADGVLLKLLEKIERDIDDGFMDHTATYEALYRAESARRELRRS